VVGKIFALRRPDSKIIGNRMEEDSERANAGARVRALQHVGLVAGRDESFPASGGESSRDGAVRCVGLCKLMLGLMLPNRDACTMRERDSVVVGRSTAVLEWRRRYGCVRRNVKHKAWQWVSDAGVDGGEDRNEQVMASGGERFAAGYGCWDGGAVGSAFIV
jgi:hypothetical protein